MLISCECILLDNQGFWCIWNRICHDAHSFKRTHYTCRYFTHVCGQHIHWRKQECTEQDCFASVCRWTLMELGRTQSVYEHDGWPSGGSFPSLQAALERRPGVTALGTEGTNNGSCEFAELGLPCLGGRSEHPSWTAHNSEGSGGVLVACGNSNGVKWERIMKVHSNHPMCWGLFMSTDPPTEKPQAWWASRSDPGPVRAKSPAASPRLGGTGDQPAQLEDM